MKRLVAAGLWGYALWYLGSMISAVLAVPDLLGPVIGLAGGLIVGIDHRHLIWVRDSAKLGAGPATSTASSAA
jgi:hypothetical protein